MHDWVAELKPGQRILDLGAGAGSLKSTDYSCSLFCVDCDPGAFVTPASPGVMRVLADASRLPFVECAFDLVVCFWSTWRIFRRLCGKFRA